MLGKPLIVIATNEPTFRWTVARLLEASGFEVAPHARDSAAVDVVCDTRPAAVVVEATYGSALSAMSIVERLRERRSTRDVPMVVCSPDTLFVQFYGDYLRGMNCVLIGRPFNAEQFVEIVHDLTSVRTPANDAHLREMLHDHAW
jgi:CheY-like chemotaxis protein